MNNYFEILENIAKGDKNSNNALIAETLIKGFFKRKFYSQKELANLCFLSQSSITKFCKKIGLEGYRELIYILKFQFQNYVKDHSKISKIEGLNKIKDNLSNINEFIENNSDFMQKIITRTKNTKEITLATSYSAFSIPIFVKNLFLDKDIKVEVINLLNNLEIASKQLNSSNNILYICLGRDNETLKRSFELIQDKSVTSLISSESQVKKFKDFDSLILLPPENSLYNRSHRILALETLMLNIYMNI